ncbi:hypothetical protein BAG01nite_34430 [Brevibacillus agri]|uniref:Uncharacterized protein n=1 Tax=Brevibacillus agri TaxID=51101 RepID=A0ABQ0SU23_9BACL|nr:hypothetical protein BAG01nite_34430 [Brevibacillus agri]
MITDRTVRGNAVFLSNMKQMVSYLQPKRNLTEIDDLYLFSIIGANRISVQDIYRCLQHLGKSRINETLFRLIYENQIHADLSSTPFDLDTEVWPYVQKENH